MELKGQAGASVLHPMSNIAMGARLSAQLLTLLSQVRTVVASKESVQTAHEKWCVTTGQLAMSQHDS